MFVSTSPADTAIAVTPSDSAAIPISRALYIGVSGDVKVLTPGSATAVTFKSVPIGFFPVQVSMVYSTGTTATNILALY